MGSIVILDLYSKDSRLTIKVNIKGLKPLDKYFAVTGQYVNMSLDQYEKNRRIAFTSERIISIYSF